MNAKQVTAAIKAISPDLTVRRADGGWRVSIAPVAIRRAYPDLTCGEAIATTLNAIRDIMHERAGNAGEDSRYLDRIAEIIS